MMLWLGLGTVVAALVLAVKKTASSESTGPKTTPPLKPPTTPASGAAESLAARQVPALPSEYRRAKQTEVPSELGPMVRQFLALPFGAVSLFTYGGRDFAAVIEKHFHPPGGPIKPWGEHKGVSLYTKDMAV